MPLLTDRNLIQPSMREVPPVPTDRALSLAVHRLRLEDVGGDDLAQWTRLARTSLEPNPFQQPEFILPLTKWLVRPDDIHLMIVRDENSGVWCYANAVIDRRPTPVRPLRHLRSLTSPHSFLDHPLVDRDHADAAFRTLFSAAASQRYWHGIRYFRLTSEGPQCEAMERGAAQSRVAIYRDKEWLRSVHDVDRASADDLLQGLSKNRRKSLRRSWQWLQSKGDVQFRLITPTPQEVAPAAEEFLRLESAGWKGAAGTSLASQEADRRFFLEMVSAFAVSGSAHFGELSIDGVPIASTCNLQGGPVLFAFKIGWDPAFSDGSPGLWSEIKLLEALPHDIPAIRRVDSCAHGESYVTPLYRQSVKTSAVVYIWSRRADALCFIRQNLRHLKQQWGGQAGTEPKSEPS